MLSLLFTRWLPKIKNLLIKVLRLLYLLVNKHYSDASKSIYFYHLISTFLISLLHVLTCIIHLQVM